jgi:hypothetical protein
MMKGLKSMDETRFDLSKYRMEKAKDDLNTFEAYIKDILEKDDEALE